MKDLLNENIIDNINRHIVESMCIADKVVDETNRLYEEILNKTAELTNNTPYNKDGYREANFNISYKLRYIGNGRINCVVRYFSLKNIAVLQNLCNRKRVISNGTSTILGNKVGSNVLAHMTVYYENIGNIQASGVLKDTLQHELNHIFQQLQMKHCYDSDSNGNLLNLNYAKLATAFNNNALMEDSDYKAVVTLLYYLNRSEEDSFVNGAYAYLTTKDKNGFPYVLDKNRVVRTVAFNHIRDCYQCLQYVEQHKQDERLQKIVVECADGCGIEKFIRQCRNLIKRFEHKFYTVVKKAKMDTGTWSDVLIPECCVHDLGKLGNDMIVFAGINLID